VPAPAVGCAAVSEADPAAAPQRAPAPPTRTPPERWGVGHAVIGYVAAFFTGNIGVGVYVAFTHESTDHLTLGLAAVGLVSLWAGLLGTVFYISRKVAHAGLREEFGFAFRWIDLPLGAAVGLASQYILIWLVYLPWRILDPNVTNRLDKPAKELTNVAHGGSLVVLAVLIAGCTPFVEELFFRGVLQRSLLRRLSPPFAIGVSAVFFGMAHEQALQLPGLVAFGVVLGYLAWRTGRLGPGIVAHACFNLVTVLYLANNR
jgi:membrane protease YdiL (CAAX protease family)